MIPKIIHYCWLSGDAYPPDFAEYQKTWKKNLPDYEFVLWDTNRFDVNSSLWVKQAFEAKKYAFAADYIRLYALYNYGGIYMDMDIEVLKPFDNILHERGILLGYETEEQDSLEGGFLGCEKGNDFIKKCMDYYTDRPFIQKSGEYDILPLPRIITPIYNKSFNDSKPFAFDYFTVKSWKTGDIIITDNSYTVHHFADTWVDEAPKTIMMFYQKMQKKYPRFIAFCLVIIYGLFVRLRKTGLKKTLLHYKHQITGK